jgi:uncharacterized membrane protein (DUF441 family)
VNPLDWATAGVSLINNLIKLHKLDEWVKLLLGFFVSWFAATTGACGAALMAHQPTSVAIGTGLTTGAACLLAVFRYSDRTKGIWIAYDQKLDLPPQSDFIGEKK